MKISPQPIITLGKMYGWRFVYYDKKAKRPRYLKKADVPEIEKIKTKQDAIDFAAKWNQKIDEKKAQLKAKQKKDLQTKNFDFLDATDKFRAYQEQFDKSYIYTAQRVERILNRLINIHELSHPSSFTERAFKETLAHIQSERNLNAGGLRKYRTAFNKFIKFLYEAEKIDYEQIRLIPISTMKSIEKDEANRHGQKTTTLGKSLLKTKKASSKSKVSRLTLKELIELLEFSIKYPNIIPEHLGRLYFIAGTIGLRRGALLALRHDNIETREKGRMYIVPDQTIQRFERDGNCEYHIGPPDHIKDIPSEIPVWLDLTRECIEWWMEKSENTNGNENKWLFPSDMAWSPEGKKGTPYAAGSLPMYPESISRPLKSYLKKASLPPIIYKNLRHTSANILTEMTDLETARKILGHKSSKTTKKFYVDPDVLRRSLDLQKLNSTEEAIWELSEKINSMAS